MSDTRAVLTPPSLCGGRLRAETTHEPKDRLHHAHAMTTHEQAVGHLRTYYDAAYANTRQQSRNMRHRRLRPRLIPTHIGRTDTRQFDPNAAPCDVASSGSIMMPMPGSWSSAATCFFVELTRLQRRAALARHPDLRTTLVEQYVAPTRGATHPTRGRWSVP